MCATDDLCSTTRAALPTTNQSPIPDSSLRLLKQAAMETVHTASSAGYTGKTVDLCE